LTRMQIVLARASDAPEIKRLLEASGLPTADLTPALLEHFLVLREGSALVAVVGLEGAGDAALLRSLSVSEHLRGGGVGRHMVEAAEAMAPQCGIVSLYLLTTTAEDYFSMLGYRNALREDVPAAIRGTLQFSGLCPSSSSFMVKTLEAEE
jgi:amino-acid N-acetyltransferase